MTPEQLEAILADEQKKLAWLRYWQKRERQLQAAMRREVRRFRRIIGAEPAPLPKNANA